MVSISLLNHGMRTVKCYGSRRHRKGDILRYCLQFASDCDSKFKRQTDVYKPQCGNAANG